MSENNKTFNDVVLEETALIFAPLMQLDSPEKVQRLLYELGWELPFNQDVTKALHDVVNFLKDDGLFNLVDNLIDNSSDLMEAETDEDRIAAAAKLVITLREVIVSFDPLTERVKTAIDGFSEIEEVDLSDLKELPKRLGDFLLVSYLQTYYQKIYGVLNLLGIIEVRIKPPLNEIYWERIPLLLSDPLWLANEVYGWGAKDNIGFDSDKFLSRLQIILHGFDLPGDLYPQAEETRETLGRADNDMMELRMPLYQGGEWPTTYIETGLNVSPWPDPGDNLQRNGFAIMPYLFGLAEIKEDLNPDWSFKLSSSLNLNEGIGLLVRPPHNLALKTNLLEKPSDIADARLEARISRVRSDDSLHLIFGSEKSSRLGFGGFGFGVLVEKKQEAEEIAFEIEINQLTLAISPGEGDGFIQKILSGRDLETVCDLILGWSNLDGVYFGGSGALELEIPIHETLGPIKIESVYLAINVEDSIKVTLAATVGAKIGPISACVEQMGIDIPITFPPDNSGNLGPLNIDGIQFKPPTSVGLAIDTDVVTGGGFIDFDTTNQRYAGTLQLAFGEIGLTAIGLITTRMPDGSKGFSMLICVNVEFSPEIQLSMGFTLSAVGGLIGVNRTMDLAVLEERFRNRALDSILLPKDPILNASRIISDLRSVFPPKEDRFVISAMAEIGYGNPKIIRGKIGIIIELPDPIRAAIMGQVSVVLPDKGKSIIVLNLDVLGIINFSEKKLEITASLYDSRILSLNIFGDAVIWLEWGHNPQFIMSLGGFHPKFAPPPGFPKLRRLTMSLNWEDVLFMSFQFYMAQTPNSLQFGAKFDLRIKWGPAEITGGLSFDTLFYFSPFYFDAEINGFVAAKVLGREVASIHVYLNLSGPTPWHAIGYARFKVLCKKFKVDFDIIKGPVRRITPIPAVDPWIPLKEALERREAWSSSLPPTRNMFESLRPIDEPKDVNDKKSMPVLVHPAGKLEVRQNVLPFEVTLDKFGNAPVINHNKFSLESVSSGKIELKCKPVKEYFAKKPFKNLTIKDQLSSESYELQQAGVEITSETIKVPGKMKAKSLEYENIPINDDGTSEKEEGKGRLSWEVGMRQIKMNAAGQSRRKGHRAFEIRDHKPGIQVNEEKFRIVFNSNMKSVSDLKYIIPNYQEDMKRNEAEAAVGKYLRKHPENLGKVQMVNSYEASV